MKEQVEKLYNRWQQYKETAEQHEFPYIILNDVLIERAHVDLQKNWTDEHALIFINGLTKMFNKMGISVW